MIKQSMTLIALLVSTASIHAAQIKSYSIQAETLACTGESVGQCSNQNLGITGLINEYGLSGNFSVDIEQLDETKTGVISLGDFTSFGASNGYSNWVLNDLDRAELQFDQGEIINFTLSGRPDVYRGWSLSDGGGEWLEIGDVFYRSLINSEPSFYTDAISGSGASTVGCYPSGSSYPCEEGDVQVPVTLYATRAGYGPLTISEVPTPAAAWLFGSALIGLAGIKRKWN